MPRKQIGAGALAGVRGPHIGLFELIAPVHDPLRVNWYRQGLRRFCECRRVEAPIRRMPIGPTRRSV